jgi:peptide/nickel transport system substrate-binding protein
MWFSSVAYSSLIHRNPQGVAEPGLATSWAYSNGGKTFTMQIRPNVKFSDGTTLNAADVVAWIEYYQKSGSFASDLADLTSVVATGPLTVQFNLSSPDPLYPYFLDQEGSVATIACSAAMANVTVLSTTTCGAGPYMIDTSATIPDSSYVYVPNPNYWDPSAIHWSKVVINIVTTDSSALAALQTGQANVALGSATTASAAKADGLKVSVESAGFVGIVLIRDNGKTIPPLAKLAVRQALNYAINRPAITKAIFGSYGTPTTEYEGKGAPGYVANVDNRYAYNPKKAKALLKMAHVKNLKFTVLVQPGAPGGSELVQAMIQDWSAVGVHVALRPETSFATYGTDVFTGKYPASSFVYYYGNFESELNEIFSQTGAYNPFKVNFASLNSLRKKIAVVGLDSATGLKYQQEAMTIAVNDAYDVNVASIDTLVYSTSGISGISFSPAFPIPDPSEWTPAN